MKHLTATFLRGLATVLPIALTVYILYWLGLTAETILGQPLKALLPDWMYHPGLGIVTGGLFVLLVGLVMELYVARKLWRLLEGGVQRIPVVKTLYGAIKDFAGFISESSKGRAMGRVVKVTVAPNMHVLGFVTREDLSDLPAGLSGQDTIAVYLPMSYQIGGYTVLLPRANVEPVDIPVEEALRFAVTAGMTTRAQAHE